MSKSINEEIERFKQKRSAYKALFDADGFVKSSSELGGSSEEIIARPIVEWLEYKASSEYFFENQPDVLTDELPNDKFKELDLDRLWDLVAPRLKDLITGYVTEQIDSIEEDEEEEAQSE